MDCLYQFYSFNIRCERKGPFNSYNSRHPDPLMWTSWRTTRTQCTHYCIVWCCSHWGRLCFIYNYQLVYAVRSSVRSSEIGDQVVRSSEMRSAQKNLRSKIRIWNEQLVKNSLSKLFRKHMKYRSKPSFVRIEQKNSQIFYKFLMT